MLHPGWTPSQYGLAIEVVGFLFFSFDALWDLFWKGTQKRSEEIMAARYAKLAPSEEEYEQERQGVQKRLMRFTMVRVGGLFLIILGLGLQWFPAWSQVPF